MVRVITSPSPSTTSLPDSLIHVFWSLYWKVASMIFLDMKRSLTMWLASSTLVTWSTIDDTPVALPWHGHIPAFSNEEDLEKEPNIFGKRTAHFCLSLVLSIYSSSSLISISSSLSWETLIDVLVEVLSTDCVMIVSLISTSLSSNSVLEITTVFSFSMVVISGLITGLFGG